MPRRILTCSLLVFPLAAASAGAQTFPAPDYFRGIFVRPVREPLPAPESLRDFVSDGQLRLTLADAIRLTLANNTEVRINQLQYEGTRFAIDRAYQAFDPVFTSSFNTRRSTTPTTDQLAGAATLSTLSQTTSLGFTQRFFTGTQYSINFNGSRNTTNSVFSNFNPSLGASLDFNVNQPLLRNRGLLPQKAPLVIARRSMQQSRHTFLAQVQDSISQAVNRYWDVVEARDNLTVLRKSLDLAEATYKRNKRELELGALPPLDIYRSESQVATRRVQVIQAEYRLKQLEDELRRTIGADLDPQIRALDVDLVESAEPSGALMTMDSQQAVEMALKTRPELEALRLQLANEDTSVQVAHNGLQPDLNLTGFYNSAGRGGNRIDTSVTPPVVTSRGGLGDAFDQLGSWDFPSYGFTLSLRLPIKNRVAEADLGIAMIARRRSLLTQRQREQAISLEARNAVHQLEQAKLSMAASRIALDLARKNLEAEQRKYELGATTIFFVLDAQQQLTQAERDLLAAQVGYQRAATAVDRATGSLLDRHKVEIKETK
jgi:outer membrane protein TolC